MAFEKKTWTDRIAEYINRRLLTKEDGGTEIVTVAREEGTISQEGDAFSAENMNDLETRIDNEFNSLNLKMGNKLGYKQIVTIKPNSSTKITFPYNSAGLIIFNGALASLFSMYQYCAFSNGFVGATISQQGTSIEYKASANVMTIKNKSTNNVLHVECLLFYGNFPSV